MEGTKVKKNINFSIIRIENCRYMPPCTRCITYMGFVYVRIMNVQRTFSILILTLLGSTLVSCADSVKRPLASSHLAIHNAATHKKMIQANKHTDAISVLGRQYEVNHFQKHNEMFTITAYNLDRYSTGKGPGDPGFGVTASGTHAQTGRTIAVDPRVIPYGSLVFIPGIGWRIAEDTGGAIRGHHIDLLVGDRKGAIAFGVRRHCKVTILVPDSSNV